MLVSTLHFFLKNVMLKTEKKPNFFDETKKFGTSPKKVQQKFNHGRKKKNGQKIAKTLKIAFLLFL